MLNTLKNFDPDKGDVDEMVELSAFARSLTAEYAALEIEPPEWLAAKQKEVIREVDARQADARAKRIKEIERSMAGLRTQEERRNDLTAELARLKAKS
jgi:hypothetical protein